MRWAAAWKICWNSQRIRSFLRACRCIILHCLIPHRPCDQKKEHDWCSDAPDRHRSRQLAHQKQPREVRDDKHRQQKRSDTLHPLAVNELRHVVEVPHCRRQIRDAVRCRRPEHQKMRQQKQAVGQKAHRRSGKRESLRSRQPSREVLPDASRSRS